MTKALPWNGWLTQWGRVRRYAVPRTMIEAATERRLAGDWRGACAAANVDVPFDFHDFAGGELAADLAVFAPDLLRWHLPRAETMVAPNKTIMLATYQSEYGPVALFVKTPPILGGHQRLRLRCSKPPENPKDVIDWSHSRHLWDATKADELRMHCGGSDRTPFFHADGTPLTEEELPNSDPGKADQAAWTEWLTTLQRSDTVKAFGAVGIEVDTTPPANPLSLRNPDLVAWLAEQPYVLTRLVDEVRRLGADEYVLGWVSQYSYSAVVRLNENGAVIRMIFGHAPKPPWLPALTGRWLPDIDLVVAGRLTPDDLHPLVRAALFPGLTSEPKPSRGCELQPVRVRCRGVWHKVEHRDGRLTGPHTEQEHEREETLQALGGTMGGCFQARQAWINGTRLVKGLRAQSLELFSRMRHGDVAGVLELLDAGIDLRARDRQRRTLLHYLCMLDHRPLLDRLVAAGLDLEATDDDGETPLYMAVNHEAPTELVVDLLAAGARIDFEDLRSDHLARAIRRAQRTDLYFLLEELDRGHPSRTRAERPQ